MLNGVTLPTYYCQGEGEVDLIKEKNALLDILVRLVIVVGC